MPKDVTNLITLPEPAPEITADSTEIPAIPFIMGKMPQKHGGSLNRQGTPGNKGGGRPPSEFVAKLRQLASNDQILGYVRQILANPEHPSFLPAWRMCIEHGYGKAVETARITTNGTLRIEIVYSGDTRGNLPP